MAYKKNIVFFIGGAKGTGKTTLISEISLEMDLPLINTGDFFYRGLPKKETKQLIIETIANFQSPLLVDTHYAGYVDNIFSGKFERGLFEEELSTLVEKVDLNLILIDLDPHPLYHRRLSDNETKRDLVLRHIIADLESNRRYFREYCEQLNKKGNVFFNIYQEETKENLKDLIDNTLFKDIK